MKTPSTYGEALVQLAEAHQLITYLADDACMYADDPPGCGDCPTCNAKAWLAP